MSDKETFLVIQHSATSNYATAYVWQGAYEDVYKLDHLNWHLDIFLLQADPTEPISSLGQKLQHVETLRRVYMADEAVITAGYYLRQLPDVQRKREVERLVQRLQTEAETSLTQVEYPATPQGDLQRLIDHGVQPLSTEEMDGLRR